MRARQKKKQRMRRVTIYVTVLIIAVSLAVGVYFATTQGPSQLDKYDNVLVSSKVMSSLEAVSAQPYGPAPSSDMQSAVYKYGGPTFTSAGKPTIVFISAEYCPFCAIERWALVMALDRFGNLSSLHYSTAANDEGDYATFTFLNSTYTSNYISFRNFETANRASPPAALQAVPSNYSTVWGSFGGGVPFLDFANAYVIKVSLLAFPDILGGNNWTQIVTSISTSDSTGLQIRQAANMITSVICKVTGGLPASVCSAPPIITSTSSISGPAPAALAIGTTYQAPMRRIGAGRPG